jgi:hypothetical protein
MGDVGRHVTLALATSPQGLEDGGGILDFWLTSADGSREVLPCFPGAHLLLPHRRRPAACDLIFQFNNHRSTIDDLDRISLFLAPAGHSEGHRAAR